MPDVHHCFLSSIFCSICLFFARSWTALTTDPIFHDQTSTLWHWISGGSTSSPQLESWWYFPMCLFRRCCVDFRGIHDSNSALGPTSRLFPPRLSMWASFCRWLLLFEKSCVVLLSIFLFFVGGTKFGEFVSSTKKRKKTKWKQFHLRKQSVFRQR